MKSILILAVLTYAEYQSGKNFKFCNGSIGTFFQKSENFVKIAFFSYQVRMTIDF